jgi:hypothetical protein
VALLPWDNRGSQGGREAVARVQDKAGHRSIWAGSRPYLVRLPPSLRLAARGASGGAVGPVLWSKVCVG